MNRHFFKLGNSTTRVVGTMLNLYEQKECMALF